MVSAMIPDTDVELNDVTYIKNTRIKKNFSMLRTHTKLTGIHLSTNDNKLLVEYFVLIDFT